MVLQASYLINILCYFGRLNTESFKRYGGNNIAVLMSESFEGKYYLKTKEKGDLCIINYKSAGTAGFFVKLTIYSYVHEVNYFKKIRSG